MKDYIYMKGSKVDKLFKILIKISNTIKYIKSIIQNTKPQRTSDPMI